MHNKNTIMLSSLKRYNITVATTQIPFIVEIELLKVTNLRHRTDKRTLADIKVIETHNTKNLDRFCLCASNQACRY